MTAAIDDPLASASGQFPLSAPRETPPSQEAPSPLGPRPWGLRNLTETTTGSGNAVTAVRYDHDQQLTVNATGIPVITMGPPTAHTTASTDGEDGPSSEDWINDFHPDEPSQA